MESYLSKASDQSVNDQSNVGQSYGASGKANYCHDSEEDVQGAVEKQLDEYVLSTSADASGGVEAIQGETKRGGKGKERKAKPDKPLKQQSPAVTDTSGSEDDETVKPGENVHLPAFQSVGKKRDPYPGGIKTQQQLDEYTDEVDHLRNEKFKNLTDLVHSAVQNALAQPPNPNL